MYYADDKNKTVLVEVTASWQLFGNFISPWKKIIAYGLVKVNSQPKKSIDNCQLKIMLQFKQKYRSET